MLPACAFSAGGEALPFAFPARAPDVVPGAAVFEFVLFAFVGLPLARFEFPLFALSVIGAVVAESVSLGELTKEGFEIRATEFIPAEAVTRHSGKVSSDAVVVTLQKSNSTAVCFYTLKAYVGKKLTTIPACTVHR